MLNMEVFRDIQHLPAFHNAVITIGTFDGVHRGHRQIIRQMLEEAEKSNGTPVLITFYPHPKQVIESGKTTLYLLNTPAEKYKLLHQAGLHHIVEVPFTREFSEQPADSYISNFLVGKFNPRSIIIGYDHRFGRDRAGDYRLLEKESGRFGYKVIEIPEHVLRDITISSTRIREALLSGAIETANEYLGYRYFFHAHVIHGDKRGRQISYPTANLHIDHERKLIPADGVYAVDVDLQDMGIYRGMMNIGRRPTVDGFHHSVEVHLFDFEKDIYGAAVRICLKTKIRDEIKFDGIEKLREQLDKDAAIARRID